MPLPQWSLFADINTSANVIGAAVTSRSPITTTAPGMQTMCPSTFTCPENDGCSYTDHSRTFTLSCGVDFYGGDLDNQYAESLQACTQVCASDAQCIVASFVGGKGSGRCYMKSQKNAATNNDGVDGMFCKFSPPSPFSPTKTYLSVSERNTDISQPSM